MIALDRTTVSVVVRNLDLPWDLVWGPDDKIWFTERTGALKRYDPATGFVELLDTVPGVYNSEDNSGLHALMLHPDFPEQPWIYVTYTFSETDLRLSRFQFGAEGLYGEEILLEMAGRDSHNGARLIMDQTGRMLMGTGDAYNPFLPQDSLSPNGKMLRLELDGSVPDDNPFPYFQGRFSVRLHHAAGADRDRRLPLAQPRAALTVRPRTVRDGDRRHARRT